MTGRRLLAVPVGAGQLMVGAADAYLLLLLASSVRSTRVPPRAARPVLRLTVLVPAHNEEGQIENCLRSLGSQLYPQDLYEVVVVADNCTDATAAVARAHGVTVLERDNDAERGKGYALNWAVDQLEASSRPHVDAYAFLDADCVAAPDLLSELAAAVEAGAPAAQAVYLASNPDAGPAAALRYAAFMLMNVIRSAGKAGLGLSAGLYGTGMILRHDVLTGLRFDVSSVVEDSDLHIRLILQGGKAAFVNASRIDSPVPAGWDDAGEQQMRWEGGHARSARQWFPRLLAHGVRRKDLESLHTAAEMLVPPLSLLGVAHGLLAVASVPAGTRARRLAISEMGALATFVLGGLMVGRAPTTVYRHLLMAPMLAAQKLRIMSLVLVGKGPSSWQRAARPE